MHANDRVGFYQMVVGVYELYGKRQPSEDILGLWFNALQRFELEAITMAVSSHINDPDSGQFIPKPADVVRHIEGRSTDRAYVAWDKLMKAVASWGQMETVIFDDPIIHTAVSVMGGWGFICSIPEAEIKFQQNHFIKIYQAERLNPRPHPPKLVGEIEHYNASKGFSGHIPVPILIGNKKKALQVLEGGTVDRLPMKPALELVTGNLLACEEVKKSA